MNGSLQHEHNLLLAALDERAVARLSPAFEKVQLVFGQRLHEPDEIVRHVYFPLDAVVSLVRHVQAGDMVEVASCAREAMIGAPAFLDEAKAFCTTLVKQSGAAVRLDTQSLRDEVRHRGVLEQALLHYTDALVTQLAQSAVCHRFHSVEQRVCRSLLQTLAGQESNVHIELTHEFLAQLLGVRRVGVTEAIGRLQAAGALRNRRGQLTVVDPEVLEARTCECHAVIQGALQHLSQSVASL